jgi:hypothetical protein
LIASRSATFEQFAMAIDDAFARWDRSHLHEFTLADDTVITPHRWWDGEEPDGSLDGAKTKLGRLRLGEQFAYVFPPILPWWGPQPSRARQATPPSGEVTEIRYRDLIT